MPCYCLTQIQIILRSLSADVTRFIPTAVKTKKDEPDKPKRPGILFHIK